MQDYPGDRVGQALTKLFQKVHAEQTLPVALLAVPYDGDGTLFRVYTPSQIKKKDLIGMLEAALRWTRSNYDA